MPHRFLVHCFAAQVLFAITQSAIADALIAWTATTVAVTQPTDQAVVSGTSELGTARTGGASPDRTREQRVPLDRVTVGLVDRNGRFPSNPEVLVYESRRRQPIRRPDGRMVTYAEFAAVDGFLVARCAPWGTEIAVRLEKLIGGGMYSVWAFVFDSPGYTASGEHLRAAGSFGPEQSGHAFTVPRTGVVELSYALRRGPLSILGRLKDCALDEHQTSFVGVYHLDSRPVGPWQLNGGAVIEQFGFTLGPVIVPG